MYLCHIKKKKKVSSEYHLFPHLLPNTLEFLENYGGLFRRTNKVVLILKKFVLKFRWVQDNLIEQLKVMFDFSNKRLATLFKQSKCFTEAGLWFYDSTTCFSHVFYSSEVNYISYKCERQKNCPKVITGKHNTIYTWQQLFHFIFTFLLQGLNLICFEHGTTAYCLSPTWRCTSIFLLVETHKAQPIKLWMLKSLLHIC